MVLEKRTCDRKMVLQKRIGVRGNFSQTDRKERDLFCPTRFPYRSLAKAIRG